mgnify:CR=1 FL=1
MTTFNEELKDKIIDIIFEQAQIHNEYGEDLYVENCEDIANLILDTILADYILIDRKEGL